MTYDQWREFFPFFSIKECGEGMDYDFMKKVLKLRVKINMPMIIHAGHDTSGHAPKSYHLLGRAIDFHVPAISERIVMSAIDSLGLFGGVGFYPKWNNPGFHIDDRPAAQYQRWVCMEPGKYIYLMA